MSAHYEKDHSGELMKLNNETIGKWKKRLGQNITAVKFSFIKE